MSARTLLLAAVALAAGLGGGIAYERSAAGAGAAPGEKKILYWVAPMDPNYRRAAPGKSPMGMDLIPVYDGEEPAAAPVAAPADGAGVVAVSPATVNAIGVRIGQAVRADFGDEIRTVGYVTLDEDRTSHVHVRGDGWVERLAVRSLGAEVRAGDLLFEVFAPELVAASYEYVRDLQRGSDSFAAGGRAKLRALGVSEPQIAEIAATRRTPERIRVLAPQDGVVTQIAAREGMYVKPDETLMTLADLSSIWVIADVFESQSARVRPGMEAEARLDHLPEDVWRGRVDYVYPDLDPATRTLKVRLRFPNPELKLRPNMFANVVLKGAARSGVLAVPAEAVIRTGRSDRVVLDLGAGRFRAVPVTVGARSGERLEILSGLEEGARVVRSGQFLIDSEASLTAGLARLETPEQGHRHEPAPPAAPEALAQTSATVNAVDAGGRTVNVTHGPIPVLGWPGMTMDFGLADAVDAAALAPGARVRLSIGRDAAGAFVVVGAEAEASS
ncbi:efflux RND transporter periplasmic adaptor subunit [Azospirillum sp. ST 5-10]|uniref:efflux RND transporter periplasmic adaptor subunit n=1 Tax=unclassified Azospirillum TaxID=2630922 RepID=UPI003F4A1A4C